MLCVFPGLPTGYCLPYLVHNFNELMQERRNSSALAMELCFSCTNLLDLDVSV